MDKLYHVSHFCSYFIWDVQICLKHYSIYGPAFLLHGIMALIALIISFRPYMMNLVPYYMLVEISTIFLHFNWFLIKVNDGVWYISSNLFVDGIGEVDHL